MDGDKRPDFITIAHSVNANDEEQFAFAFFQDSIFGGTFCDLWSLKSGLGLQAIGSCCTCFPCLSRLSSRSKNHPWI